MSLAGKEFDSNQVCLYGASQGLWPWVRKEKDTCSSLKWFDISLLVYPWDHGTKTVKSLVLLPRFYWQQRLFITLLAPGPSLA